MRSSTGLKLWTGLRSWVISDTTVIEATRGIAPALFLNQMESSGIPEGGDDENIETCAMADQLLSGGSRSTYLILNIGGGVVTDLVAFCASTFQRGIRFINIPTSLLALQDAVAAEDRC